MSPSDTQHGALHTALHRAGGYRYTAIDLRWLGIFRVLFGGLLIVDLFRRWGVLRDFYSNDGILPNHFSLFRPLGRDVFSLLHAFSSPGQVHVFFALALVVFVTFALGYRTKLFHVLSLVCITSLNARNILVENGGTVVVNLLCFWTLFLPLGARFSVDALLASLRRERESNAADLRRAQEASLADDSGDQGAAKNRDYALAMLALLLQWSVIYFFNTVNKLPGEGWQDGSALHWFLHQDRIVTAFGIFLREHAPYVLLRFGTYATLAIELVLSFILLVPFWQVGLRRIALLLAILLHGGIAATSRLGPFSYAMTLFFVLPLGARDYDVLARWLGRGRGRRTVIFDADCGLCFWLCRVLRRLDVLGRLEFVGNDEPERLPADLDRALLERTVVVIDEQGRRHVQERALAAVLGALPLGGLLAVWFLVPGLSALARRAYDWVAQHRTELSARFGLGACGLAQPGAPVGSGEPSAPPMPERRAAPGWLEALGRRPTRFLREVLVVLALVMVGNQIITDNAVARRYLKSEQPKALLAVMDTFRLYQGWRMFAPEPPYEDGRLVVDARTADGRKVDPFTGRVPEFDPYTTEGWGHDQFWCDYHLKMYFAQYAPYRQFLVDYLKRWHVRTGRDADRLVAFDVWWVHDKSPPPGQERGEPQSPIKLVSFGKVKDSLATPWLRDNAEQARAEPR